MALRLIVNGRDLTEFNRMAHGDGHEPASADAFDPQFTGSTAIGEGQSFVGNSLGNVAMSFPLILKAASTDALYQLIRDIRTDLVKGNTVEYRSGGASQSTFFDMESGKLEPNFEFWLDQNARCRAQLTIWRRPYGHTGTSRVIASAVGTGPMTVTATGILGDVDAQAKLQLCYVGERVGPAVWGVKHPAPSGFNPIWTASRLSADNPLSFSVSTTVSATSLASGRIANTYCAWAVGSTIGMSMWSAGTYYSPLMELDLAGGTYFGRYRVLANVRMRAYFPNSSSRVELKMAGNRPVSLMSSQNWMPVDLGEVNIPKTNYGDRYVSLTVSSFHPTAPNASIVATFPFQMDGVTLVPLENNAGLISRPTGYVWTGASAIVTLDGSTNTAEYSRPGITQDAVSELRGNWPALPPVGSPAASGAAMIVLWPMGQTSGKEPLGNRSHSVSVSVRERFSYMR